jgi:ketosteroid isomerase-like protein
MNLNKPICLSLLLTTLTFAKAAPADDSELLEIRETVWRAWFANDKTTLARLVPAETIVITASEKEWKHQTEVLKEAAEFQTDGGKLLRLEFPQTEVQHFGDVAIIWSTYELETEVKGKRSSSGGRVTEIFVRRDGQWTNPGWQTSHPPGS